MNISKVKLVYYSPTGTGKTTGIEIAKGTGLNYDSIDLTLPSRESKKYTIANDELGIIVIPVYGGRIAPVALERIKHVTGNSTPAQGKVDKIAGQAAVMVHIAAPVPAVVAAEPEIGGGPEYAVDIRDRCSYIVN